MNYILTAQQESDLLTALGSLSKQLNFGYRNDNGNYVIEDWVIERLDFNLNSIYDLSTVESEEAISSYKETGWATYVDTEYTESNKYKLFNEVKVTLPNNAGFILDSQKPYYIDSFYDSSSKSITGRNGDGIIVTIEFWAVPKTNKGSLSTSIDIGGTVGEIYPRLTTFRQKKNEAQPVSMSISGYTLDTWEANGGKLKIITHGDFEIYGIRYVITNSHKAN